MDSEIFVKNIELKECSKAQNQKAVIKSKWSEDRVEIEIFVKEDSAVYKGSQTNLRKAKDLKSIKDAITEEDVEANFELEIKKQKLFVTNSSNIIYLKVDVTKLDDENVLALVPQLVEEEQKLRNQLKKSNEKCKQMKKRLEEALSEKEEFERKVLSNTQLLLNTKKHRIADLEQQIKLLKDSKKFESFNSTFDLAVPVKKSSKMSHKTRSSDELLSEAQPSTSSYSKVSRKRRSNDELQDAQPSTSNYISPSRKKIDSKAESPRTPRASNVRLTQTLSSHKLFQFNNEDPDDEPKYKRSKNSSRDHSPISPDTFANIKVTPKKERVKNDNSDIDLFSPNPKARKRLNSSSSDESENKEPPQSAQNMISNELQEFPLIDSKKRQRRMNSDEVMRVEVEDPNDDIVPNSQSSNSPSIFEQFPKRKFTRTNQGKVAVKKSKFSIDTIDVLANDSFST